MAFKIPTMLLKRLYTVGSLENNVAGFQFSVKNRLTDTTLSALVSLTIDGTAVDLQNVTLGLGDGTTLLPSDFSVDSPFSFPLRQILNINVKGEQLAEGKHKVGIAFEAESFGQLKFSVKDKLTTATDKEYIAIPRSNHDDYSPEIIKKRLDFVQKYTGAALKHIPNQTFDPHSLAGNIENFIGVAQVPLGVAGPIHIDGEHAKGDFLVPMATTEGTLLASYNRGIKLLNLSGGVTCSVVDDAMQRAPVFVFNNAREARDFVKWIRDNHETIAAKAEATSSVAKLKEIDPYLVSKFAYLRFNYTTGDAAGQNMVGKATFAACNWILDNYTGIKNFLLEANLATDKKASQVNIMRTRGKRVVAEAVLKKDVLQQYMRVDTEKLYFSANIANVGAMLSGANNNGAHSANAIASIFIATGQDEANVAESSAAIFYSEMTTEGDMYISLTIPSLIVATFGGGTGLATQNESLAIMGCVGRGKVNKLAEIIAGVALAGEISLTSAIASSDWVSSHEQYGRNR